MHSIQTLHESKSIPKGPRNKEKTFLEINSIINSNIICLRRVESMLAKNSVRRRVSTIFTLFVLSYLLLTTLSRSPIRLSHSARDTSRLSVPPLVLMATALKFTFNLYNHKNHLKNTKRPKNFQCQVR